MIIRQNMTNIAEGCNCEQCNYYPFFHYVPSKLGDDIEFIKHDENNSTVENHTTKKKYIYKNKKWEQQQFTLS